MAQNNVIHQLEGNVPQYNLVRWEDETGYIVEDYIDDDYIE